MEFIVLDEEQQKIGMKKLADWTNSLTGLKNVVKDATKDKLAPGESANFDASKITKLSNYINHLPPKTNIWEGFCPLLSTHLATFCADYKSFDCLEGKFKELENQTSVNILKQKLNNIYDLLSKNKLETNTKSGKVCTIITKIMQELMMILIEMLTGAQYIQIIVPPNIKLN